MTTVIAQPRKLGATGPEIFPLALGCMGMSGMYGAADETESIATIQAAMDAGVKLIDTGDFYGMGHNEMLIGRALGTRRDEVLLSVKFGAQRAPDGSWIGYDARPAAVKTWLSYTLKRLGVEHLYLFGSTVRGEAREDSDVDMFFDYERGKLGLFELMDVKEAAARILGRKADIMTRDSLHKTLRERIEAAALQVF